MLLELVLIYLPTQFLIIHYAEISNSVGSYNTLKHTVKFSTGKLNDSFEFSGRLSKIDSDGYVDRAYSDLKSYFLQGLQ